MNQFSKYKLWQPILLAASVVLGMIIGVKMAPDLYKQEFESTSTSVDAQHKIQEVLKYLESHYVDSISIKAFTDQMIDNGMHELDPHSLYLTKEQAAREETNRAGRFKGIGIDFFHLNDTLILNNVIPGSPADSAGMRPLDKLLTINGISLLEQTEVRDKSLQIRDGLTSHSKIEWLSEDGQKKDANLTSKFIELSPIEAAFAINKIGYIRISRFTKGTYKAFMQSLEKLADSAKINNLIIDVRDNPGGYMQDAVQILSQFIPQKGQLLVYTKTKDGRKREYKSDGRNFFPIEDIAVLINENSASASEIIAGVIQDLDRGTIVGMPSFGKGLVQQQFDLSDGSALYITTERYYTPSGRLIQKPYRYKEEIFADHLLEDSIQYYTRRGDSVTASGGIVPDIVVAGVAEISPTVLNHLRQHGIIFAYNWIKTHRPTFNKLELQDVLRAVDLVQGYIESTDNKLFNLSPVEKKYVQTFLMYKIMAFKSSADALEWYTLQEDQVVTAISSLTE